MSRVVRLSVLLICAAIGAGAASAPASAADPAPVWACLPGVQPNPCDGSLATTYLSSTTLQKRRVTKVEEPAKDAARPVDCFYVYPTVTSTPRANAPGYLTREVKSILEYQAARFSQVCEVYAPVYRQATLFGIIPLAGGAPKPGETPKPLAAFETAYADVKRAWDDYLANHNRGRGVVLIGHSQGSGMLIRLMHDEIDGDAALRSRIVSAIVPGGNLTVKKGERAGGDLENIPLCASRSETGCALAWSTFASSPGRDAFFGRTGGRLRASGGLETKPGTEVACTNPAELSGDGGRFDALTRREAFPGLIGIALRGLYWGLPPKANTPWVSPGERYRGSCRQLRNDAHVLLVKPANPQSVLPLESPWPAWGLHFADVNLPLGNLIRIVRSQIAAYAAAQPAAGQPAAGA